MIDLQRLKDGEVVVNASEVIDLHMIVQEQVIAQIRHMAIPPFEDTESEKGLSRLKCREVTSLINEVCRSIDAGIVDWANKQMEKHNDRQVPTLLPQASPEGNGPVAGGSIRAS